LISVPSHAESGAARSGPHRIYQGSPASAGIAFGPAFVLEGRRIGVEAYAVKPGAVEAEIARLREAVEAAKNDVRAMREEFASAVDATLLRIFDGHLGLLEDPELIEKTEERIAAEQRNAEAVLSELIQEQVARIEKLHDEKAASIGADLRDVGQRILSHMTAAGGEAIRPSEWSIVVAHDLAPSQTVHMARERVAGFVTDIGGPVSHTALLAKALEIPAVVGLGSIAAEVPQGTPLIIDGFAGRVIANPSAKESEQYRKLRREWRARGSALGRLKALPAETRDGYLVDIAANIELPSEVDHVLAHGAAGIGLFRSEFLYLGSDRLPSEDEQFEVYRSVLRRMKPRPVVLRTLDLGGDKFLSHVSVSRELNPFLGLRAIRLCLRYPEVFKTQLRAMLRASPYGKARIMFPLVTGIMQVRQAKAILGQVREELAEKGVPFSPEVEVGIMIEVPSAALTADILAGEVDFFSIGTNDLIQYTLAVDRVNEQVADLYDPHHPSVLRLIRNVIECGHRRGIWVGLCGEMAGNPDLACLLVGMGVDELSMAASAVPEVKQRIRSVAIADLKELSQEVLTLTTSQEIRELMAKRVPRLIRRRSARGSRGAREVEARSREW